MQWHNIQTALRNAGHLVYAMDQAQTEILTTPGPWGNAYGGYCLGAASRWIQLRSWDSDFPYDANTQVCDGLDWRSTVIQNVAADANPATNIDVWVAATAAHGMRVNAGLRQTVNQAVDGATLTQMMANGAGWYGITMLGQADAHAIAAEHATDGTYHLFDANYGHIVSPDANAFRGLMDWFFTFTGYDPQYGQATIMVGVDP